MRIAAISTLSALALVAALGLYRTASAPELLPVAAVGANLLPVSDTIQLVPNGSGTLQPVPEFLDRITKKDFRKYITPDTSPIANDTFTGYHTGVDAEFTDTGADIPVVAIADGTLVLAKWVNGYGGLVVVKHVIDGRTLFALYGHLDEASFPPAGTTTVARGQRLGILGDDHSHETDGVRKHLHFAIYTGEHVDYRGYVPHEEDLVNWLDPLTLYR